MNARLLLLACVAIAAPATARHADDKPAAPPLLASIDGLPLGQIPKQQLPDIGCAAYLWSAGQTHALIAMASANPATLRMSLDGTVSDYPRVAEVGVGGYGLDRTTTYQAGAVKAVLDMTIRSQSDLTAGAMVPAGTLTVERAGKDTVIVPVAGLIGCAVPTGGK